MSDIGREIARVTRNPARAIYGTIVATAVIVVTGSHDEPAGAVAAATSVTLVVFWVAHVYSAVLDHRYSDRGFRWRTVWSIMVEELPMVEAPALAIGVLLLGVFRVVPDALAINMAQVLGVLQLIVWGLVAARRAGWSWPATLLASAIDGGLGLLIIGLKSLLH